jgi:DNA polymerase elongation subunit (family B)
MDKSFRLLEFNVYDGQSSIRNTTDDDSNYQNEEGGKRDNKSFIVQMFGINEQGQTCSIFAEGYKPFFYVSVPDNWSVDTKLDFVSHMRDLLGEFYEDSIVDSKLVKRKKLYGFDAGKLHKFIKLEFKNEKAMKKAVNIWYDIDTKNGGYNKKLKKGGYYYNGDFLELYESNIPPLLRLFHIKDISPSGWVAIPLSLAKMNRNKITSCHYEFTIKYSDIIPLPNKETIVPYKIASFDIEASSSHGDFPLPKKNYKKLAQNIIEIYKDYECNEDFLEEVILTAFGYSDLEDVDRVFPKEATTKSQIENLFTKWIKMCPGNVKCDIELDDDKDDNNNDNEEDNEDDNDNGTTIEEGHNENGNEVVEASTFGFMWNKKKKINEYKNKKASIVNMLNDDDCERDTKILELTKTLSKAFPPLKGDEVTFIGTTFLNYGQDKPYLNNCLVVGTCDPIENAEIQTFTDEKSLLLGWTELIKRENPDVIIGYNIFGFDYEFMFKRAEETKCINRFLKLSRNVNEDCCPANWQTNQRTLDGNMIVLASGQYDLKFIKMNGRLQIDLYNYFRRDYNLTSYKLDYVAGYFIGDVVKKLEHTEDGNTKIYSKNLTGLEENTYINFEENSHTSEHYKDGQKFEVIEINRSEGSFIIKGIENPNMQKVVKWGMAKDDVTPQDIFRMTNEGPAERAIIAKYCIQDCNLVHHLMRKIDVITGYVEMAKLCSVPLNFLVQRGQGIKLTSYVAKKCREKNTLLPVIEKNMDDGGYEGAIVLPPKCGLYLDNPVACVDFGSLYPSSMISENISHDTKVWTKEFDLTGKLLKVTGYRDASGSFMYDNMDGYEYVDVTYDTYSYIRKNPTSAAQKVKTGYKICRFTQPKNGQRGVMPAILEELLAARKATRKQAEKETDEFMQNVLDKRQLSIKVTANSLYGQCGARTSTFYEKDVAASTTATGRKLLTYAKRVIEESYYDAIVPTENYGNVKSYAEYIYGDTDSVFFTFNLEDMHGKKITGQTALEITIELAQQAGALATKFLKHPHDLEYEKTFLPFCLLSKKRYVGMLYEFNAHKCYRKSMGIVLKRRDNAPIVKDIYGGIIDILMKEKNIGNARQFLDQYLQRLVDGKIPIEKLIITKALRSGYKNPNQIAHKVLADRMGKRDPGNKPGPGDRIPFAFIQTKNAKALQGEKIEHPLYIKENNLKLNYTFYITNQIMKPIQQLFALVLEEFQEFKRKKDRFQDELNCLQENMDDEEKFRKKETDLRNKEVKAILFDKYLRKAENLKNGNQEITAFLKKK